MSATPTSLELTSDPLVAELLPMVQAAANDKVSAFFASIGAPDDVAIRTTQFFPFDRLVGPAESEYPVLACFVSKSQRKWTTLSHLDHYATLTFQYVSPATSFESLSARWPLLHLVWRAITDTLYDGFSLAWKDGARTLEAAGLVRAELDTAKYDALFARGGDFSYPMFTGAIDVVWRDVKRWRFNSIPVPFRALHADLFCESSPATADAPDVQVFVGSENTDLLNERALDL